MNGSSRKEQTMFFKKTIQETMQPLQTWRIHLMEGRLICRTCDSNHNLSLYMLRLDTLRLPLRRICDLIVMGISPVLEDGHQSNDQLRQ
jgi:hypothetical protein